MSQMKQQVRICASPSTVYQSLSTQAGLRAWWTSDMIVEPRVGSIAEFSHGEEGTHLRARLVELVPDNQVVWDCLGYLAVPAQGLCRRKNTRPFFKGKA